jgi:hypothetical protein
MAFLPVTGEDSPLPRIDPQTAQNLIDQQADGGFGQPQISPDLFAQIGSGAEGGPVIADDLSVKRPAQGTKFTGLR